MRGEERARLNEGPCHLPSKCCYLILLLLLIEQIVAWEEDVFDHDSDDDNDCEDDYGVNEDDADDDHGDKYEGDDIVKGLKSMIVVMMWKRGVTWHCVLVALCQMGEGSGKLDPCQAPEQNLAFKIL